MWPRLLSLSVTTGICLGIVACGGDPPTPPKIDSDTVLWHLRLVPNSSIIMVKGDTLQVALQGLSVNLKPVPLVESNIDVESDADGLVSMSRTGILVAHDITPPGAPIKVVANYESNGSNLADTLFVTVTPTREPIHSIVFRPDSAAFTVFYGYSPNAMALDADGNVLPDVFVSLSTSASPFAVSIDRQYSSVTFAQVGKVWLYGSTTAYGKRFSDSLLVTVKYFPLSWINLVSTAHGIGIGGAPPIPMTQSTQACGTVSYTNSTSSPINITFSSNDPPISCAMNEGDTTATTPIVNLPVNAQASRRFATRGTTKWIVARTSAAADSLTSGIVITE